MKQIFLLLAILPGSIAAQSSDFDDPDYNETDTNILPMLRLRLDVFEKLVQRGVPSQKCQRDLELAYFALNDVIHYEKLFKSMVKMRGFEAAAIFIANDFEFHHVDGRILDKKQYLEFLSKRNDLTFYFGNPQNAHYGDNQDLYVAHEDNHTRYQFQFKSTPHLTPKFQLVSVKLEPLWFKSASNEALRFEKAFREMAVVGWSKAEIYIDPNFVYTDFNGKKKNRQQFLDYLSHDGILDIYFSNPINPEFDKKGNLVYSHVDHHVNFRCVAKPASLKGGYVLVSVTAGVQKKLEEFDSARTSSSEEE